MADYALHCFAQSGNAYKAALMLELTRSSWKPVFVDFFNGAARSPEYAAINEMAEVPTLTHGDIRLSQSGVILDYLSETTGQFGPEDAAGRREILRWTLWDNHKLTANIATARFMQCFLPEKHRNADVIAFLMGRARAALKTLDARLNGRDWIVGDATSTADLSCIGYIFFLDEIGIDTDSDYPNVARWRDTVSNLPHWRHPYDLMPGHPLPARD